MDDIRAQPSQQPPQPSKSDRTVAWRFVEGEHGNVAALYALTKHRVVRQAHDRVAKALRGNPIDQIDQTVLEPAHVESKDDMSNERRFLPSARAFRRLRRKIRHGTHTVS